ncbi:MAG: hypothetical protein GX295_07340 [Syntrophomonadaceae bacterium]|nr:hypothetical protein [Syntrophomonadaceae bacterium]
MIEISQKRTERTDGAIAIIMAPDGALRYKHGEDTFRVVPGTFWVELGSLACSDPEHIGMGE